MNTITEEINRLFPPEKQLEVIDDHNRIWAFNRTSVGVILTGLNVNTNMTHQTCNYFSLGELKEWDGCYLDPVKPKVSIWNHYKNMKQECLYDRLGNKWVYNNKFTHLICHAVQASLTIDATTFLQNEWFINDTITG
jgi:hypothetical protein